MSSGIKGTFALTSNVFVRWEDFEEFHEDIVSVCEILAMRSGLEIDVDVELLKIAHSTWMRTKADWKARLMPDGTKVLSHLKQSAILIEKLCQHLPIRVSQERVHRAPPDDLQDGGGPPMNLRVLSPEVARRYVDGGCHYVAWQIGLHICDYFESRRLKRIDPYVLRITDEFELDMVSSLISGRMTDVSIWMTLKALFLRD